MEQIPPSTVMYHCARILNYNAIMKKHHKRINADSNCHYHNCDFYDVSKLHLKKVERRETPSFFEANNPQIQLYFGTLNE